MATTRLKPVEFVLDHVDLIRSKATGQWRWQGRSTNNKKIGGPGESHTNKDHVQRMIEAVTDATNRGIPIVVVVDETKPKKAR